MATLAHAAADDEAAERHLDAAQATLDRTRAEYDAAIAAHLTKEFSGGTALPATLAVSAPLAAAALSEAPLGALDAIGAAVPLT